MNALVLIAASLLPAAVLLAYVLIRDTAPEPAREILRALLWGVLIIIPIVPVEILSDAILFGPDGAPATIAGAIARAFCTAAIPEEGFKLLALVEKDRMAFRA
ncbi:MAG: PrsW family glutamic-type intramembrane protease [Bacteroidaceae bacterium]|nr:PrsW family glutamic-type intramembrane protease [Bacteroidaceae bacterium]